MSEELWRHAGDETVTSHVRQGNVVIDYELTECDLVPRSPRPGCVCTELVDDRYYVIAT